MYPSLHLYIDGRFEEGQAGAAVLDPASGQALGVLQHASVDQLDRSLLAAANGFEVWRRTSAYDRARLLRRAADLVRERVEPIAQILTAEQGKILAEARTEVAYAADVLEWCAEEGKRTYGRVIPGRDPAIRQLVVREPVGVAAAFTPWNFPTLTPARKLGGALAAGCSIILKASEETPATALELVRALHDAGVPAGVVNLVQGVPAAISEHLLASPIIRKLSFTGSIPVGRRLMALALDDLKRTTMELGGHAPVVVMDDVDVAAVAALAAAGKFRNAGQVCVAPTRFYVHETVHDAFVERLVAFAGDLTVAAGADPGARMGPLVNMRRVQAMERFMDDARTRGGRVRCGGRRRGNVGCFFEPTVVTDLPDDALLMTDEPFGPIAPVSRFSDIEDVLARANSLPFGLAAYAFTNSAKVSTRLADGLKAGMVGVNTLAISTPETPFGGVKHSGHGQEGGVEGLEAYLDVKFIAHA